MDKNKSEIHEKLMNKAPLRKIRTKADELQTPAKTKKDTVGARHEESKTIKMPEKPPASIGINTSRLLPPSGSSSALSL